MKVKSATNIPIEHNNVCVERHPMIKSTINVSVTGFTNDHNRYTTEQCGISTSDARALAYEILRLANEIDNKR